MELDTSQITKLVALNCKSVNRYLRAIGERIAQFCETPSPFFGEIEVTSESCGLKAEEVAVLRVKPSFSVFSNAMEKFIRKYIFGNKDFWYFNVVLAEDDRATLEEVKRKLLIISDWHMPNRVGLDLFKELAKDRKLILFLLITAEKEYEKFVEAVAAGIKECTVKLVKSESLGNKIKEVVFGTA